MSESPETFCRGSKNKWNAFCSSAQIFASTDRNDLLIEPVTLPANLPQLIQAALDTSPETYSFKPLISQTDFDLSARIADFIEVVPEDSMNFAGHMPHLCRLYNRLGRALVDQNQQTSEAAIRRAVDDVFELALQNDRDAWFESSYIVETRVHVVKYDKQQLPNGPTEVATSDGAVVTKLPRPLIKNFHAGGIVHAGPDLFDRYALSFVEYKGGLRNNGRQAILDSAAMQAVNRAFGLRGVKNYAFSVHHAAVDIITSWWEEAVGVKNYKYLYNRSNDRFLLDTPIEWFRFFSFLCRLRAHHHGICTALRNAVPSTPLEVNDLFHMSQLPSISEQADGGNDETSHSGSGSMRGNDTGAQEPMDDGLELGEEAMWREISVEEFCRDESDDEDEDADEDDEKDEDAMNNLVTKTSVQGWMKNIVVGLPSHSTTTSSSNTVGQYL
ncbi:hypothetical protein K438DRAFT_1882110 [Mycena galopus ATCC 62051]|nr:hypothetical protein K438DRAFT_1882110 [Mycena galopus ATCC 62051]